MKKFKTNKAAMEYAKKEIRKNNYEIVLVNGKKTFLCATSIPAEELIREKLETILEEFVEVMGEEDKDEYIDGINFIGVQMDEIMCKMIEKHLGFKILVAGVEY